MFAAERVSPGSALPIGLWSFWEGGRGRPGLTLAWGLVGMAQAFNPSILQEDCLELHSALC